MELSKINQATLEDLDKVEGIGHERAVQLLKYRDEHGDFESWEEVKNVPGFSEELIDILRTSNNNNNGDEEEIETEE